MSRVSLLWYVSGIRPMFTNSSIQFNIVNVSELIELHKNEIMAVKDKDTGDNDSSILDNGQCRPGRLLRHKI